MATQAAAAAGAADSDPSRAGGRPLHWLPPAHGDASLGQAQAWASVAAAAAAALTVTGMLWNWQRLPQGRPPAGPGHLNLNGAGPQWRAGSVPAADLDTPRPICTLRSSKFFPESDDVNMNHHQCAVFGQPRLR